MTTKISNQSEQLKINQNKKLQPIQTNRKLNKLKLTDNLVAPVERVEVPNHLLNTKIYAKLQRNDVFEVTPVEIHFSGFEVSKDEQKKYVQILRVINISGQLQRMTVLPPLNKYFDIQYVKQERLVAGFALEIKVFFRPEEYKYYNDAIRIFSEGNENLYVPIHAYPIISSFDFPTKYKFPDLAIGKSLTRSFKLRSTAPIEFEYIIEIIERHAAFQIEPLEGIIPFNKDATIDVTFSPKEFCTAVMTIQLIISQFNSNPIVCTFYGTSRPGLARDEVFNKYTKLSNINEKTPRIPTETNFNEKNQNILNLFDSESLRSKSVVDSRVGSVIPTPSKQTGPRQLKDLSIQQINKDVAPKKDDYVDYEGYRVPQNLNTPWAISKVLIQTKGKLSLKDLKSSAKSSSKISAQAKEAIFLQRVNELEDEERRNQLKWQVKLGESTVDLETREDILHSRAKAEYEYKLSIGIPFLEQEINRQRTAEFECRTVRYFNKLARTDITFDTFKNQIWQLRFMALDTFVQAVRKVIVKNRLLKVLSLIKRFIDSWNEILNDSSDSGIEDIKLNIENYIEIYSKKLNGENLDKNQALKVMNKKNIGTYYFPQITEFKEFQDQKARHCEKLSSISKLESLGVVAVKPIEFQMPTETPYINLAVPIQYKLNLYKPTYDNNYVPKHENRIMKLRSGAEDELTQIDSSPILPVTTEIKDVTISKELDKKSVSTQENLSQSSRVEIKPTQIIDLVPSKQLSEPVDYNPLHIFNPAPGLISYQKALPYSGIDLNHHLNPLPRFERDQTFSTQKKFLDKDDIIKGIMAWKKFPSQGLISLSNTPTLTDVWVPRWSNTFGTDVMPVDTPPLLVGLPEDDKENLTDDTEPDNSSTVSKEPKIYLTPEMVNVQFNIPDIFEIREKNIREEQQFPYNDKLPSTNMPVSLFGQVPRDQREQELEFFLNKQYNTLGLKIQKKMELLDQQFSTNPNTTTGLNQLNSSLNVNQSNLGTQQTNQNIRSAANMSSALLSNSAATIVNN